MVSSVIFGSVANAETFNAGNIIDESVFTNNTTMDVNAIQNFLNSKVPSCDTNGTQPAYDFGRGDLTHAQYAALRGWQGPPYTCVRNLTENGKSAAQIIYDVSQQFRINPQTMIVTLQKESSLVTDTWPLNVQYRAAMGYGCPDSGPNNSANCDSSYYGFTNQMTWAARMFRAIMDASPTWYTPYTVGTNYIQWSPQAGCGGTNVYIQNRSTAALYNYTPYQPNAAALNAGYGMGDSCSAYGNRNFFLYFRDWFGATQSPPIRTWAMSDQGQIVSGSNQSTNAITTAPSKKVTVYIKALNSGNQVWYRDNTFLATAHPNDRTSDFSDSSWPGSNRPAQLNEPVIRPGEIGTFTFVLNTPNKFFSSREYFNIVHEGVAWENDIGFYFDVNVAVPQDSSYNARITSSTLYYDQAMTKPLSFADSRIRPGQAVYGEVAFQNTGGATMTSSIIKLGTYGPADRTSTFQDSTWLSSTRAASLVEASVKPTETGHIRFTLRPSTARWFTESFALLAEGITWMQNSSVSYRVEVTQDYPSSMTSGQTIVTGTQLMSRNLKYRLIIQLDGNMVLYNNSTPIWNSNTVGANKPTLVMQSDGNLVLYAIGTVPVWNSATVTGQYSKLQLQDDGNLVLYASGNQPRWSTGTSGR